MSAVIRKAAEKTTYDQSQEAKIMKNIITELAERKNEINKIKEVFISLPDSEPDDLAVTLAVRILFDTRMFSCISSSDMCKVTQKMCCEDDQGICIFQAYKLIKTMGNKLNFDSLSLIMFGILSVQIGADLDLASLDAYAFTLSQTFNGILSRTENDMGIVACALLILAGREEHDRFNFAYDTLLPAFEEQVRSTYDMEKNIVSALELLYQAENDMRVLYNDYDLESVTDDPVLYRALLTAVLADFMGDDLYKMYSTFSELDYFTAESLLNGKSCDAPEEEFCENTCETKESDPFDDLDWDEFFISEE